MAFMPRLSIEVLERKRSLKITTAGHRIFKAAAPALQVGRESLLLPLNGRERKQFISYLRRVLAARDPGLGDLLKEDLSAGAAN